MTYFGFLALFLLPPLALIFLATYFDRKRGAKLPEFLSSWPLSRVVLAHVIVALIYTTLWDNYLVATRVWWYDPDLVTGITIGWVPIEEYTFFILQTLISGLWLGRLARHIAVNKNNQILPSSANQPKLRYFSTFALLPFLIWSVIVLVSGWQPGNYIALILVWALPPIMLQTFFGADILWNHKWLIFIAIASTTLYLAAADFIAINSGTWTINPNKTLGIYIAGSLPIEEFIFFLMTNVLVVFGVTLVLSRDSKERIPPKLLPSLKKLFVPGE